MNVTVYSTPTCPWCKRAKEYLTQRGVPYRDIDVSRDGQAAQEMVRHTGQQGVPVIAIDGQYIVGFDRPRIERALASAAPGRPSLGASIADAATVRSRPAGQPGAWCLCWQGAAGLPGRAGRPHRGRCDRRGKWPGDGTRGRCGAGAGRSPTGRSLSDGLRARRSASFDRGPDPMTASP